MLQKTTLVCNSIKANIENLKHAQQRLYNGYKNLKLSSTH